MCACVRLFFERARLLARCCSDPIVIQWLKLSFFEKEARAVLLRQRFSSSGACGDENASSVRIWSSLGWSRVAYSSLGVAYLRVALDGRA